jgi:hypothetical protein
MKAIDHLPTRPTRRAAIAGALRCKVHVSAAKKATLDAIGDAALSALLTTNPRETRLHVLPMNMLAQAKLAAYLRQHGEQCDAVKVHRRYHALPLVTHDGLAFDQGLVKPFLTHTNTMSLNEMNVIVGLLSTLP